MDTYLMRTQHALRPGSTQGGMRESSRTGEADAKLTPSQLMRCMSPPPPPPPPPPSLSGDGHFATACSTDRLLTPRGSRTISQLSTRAYRGLPDPACVGSAVLCCRNQRATALIATFTSLCGHYDTCGRSLPGSVPASPRSVRKPTKRAVWETAWQACWYK